MVSLCILLVRSVGLQLLGAEVHVKPIAIGTVIVLAVILGTRCGKFLRVKECR